jgi:hypothetical protein
MFHWQCSWWHFKNCLPITSIVSLSVSMHLKPFDLGLPF